MSCGIQGVGGMRGCFRCNGGLHPDDPPGWICGKCRTRRKLAGVWICAVCSTPLVGKPWWRRYCDDCVKLRKYFISKRCPGCGKKYNHRNGWWDTWVQGYWISNRGWCNNTWQWSCHNSDCLLSIAEESEDGSPMRYQWKGDNWVAVPEGLLVIFKEWEL